MSRVYLTQTDNRSAGVKALLDALPENPVKGKAVLIKPNFNTADPAPGSTHNDTLLALIDRFWEMGARAIRLGERSYPLTAEVLQQKNILPALETRQVRVLDFDRLPDRDWVAFEPTESHWSAGFRIARPVLEAECLVSTGCLKTHQFGGVFTLALKLHVGCVPTFRHGYAYMQELHGSAFQQEMIAEINAPFAPHLVLLDGRDAFVDGGPATGKRVQANVLLASADRVAADAVGVALLKHLGSNPAIMGTPIFAQRQIVRAVELGLGVGGAAEIELKAADVRSVPLKDAVQRILTEA